ncbi:hypothetical protein HORIV_16520 [Vreelandella olivaria]|uniref:Cytochrome c oxidase subunit 1 n=1 Tax=Vreelandella olivaria TaxID=390919 RepID=A0ABM7GET7_9GAMM|nr:hypothetical protein HORIV_16520 [Halomonas olivaria]
MFGKLTLESIPYHEPIIMVVAAFMAIGGIALFGLITYYRKWGWLWNEWFTSVDHKKLGIMYFIVALVMLLRGFSDAIMMRTSWRWPPGMQRAICRLTTTIRSLLPTA